MLTAKQPFVFGVIVVQQADENIKNVTKPEHGSLISHLDCEL